MFAAQTKQQMLNAIQAYFVARANVC